MSAIDEYVARIEGTCGKEEDVIVIFNYEKKDEALRKIRAKAQLKKSIAGVVFEMIFKNYSFRLYGSGKAIFRSLKDKAELNSVLSDLLS